MARPEPVEVRAAMVLDIPDDILRRGELGAADLRLALAVQLYADNRIDHADACRLAGTSAARLNRELVRLGLSVQEYPPERAQPRRSVG